MRVRVAGISSILALAGAFSISMAASAVEISVIGPNAITVDRGEIFTIDLALDNVSGSSVAAITVELSGMAGAGASVVGGRAAQLYFVDFCTSTSCFGVLSTVSNGNFNPDDLSENLTFNRDETGQRLPGDDIMFVVGALAAPFEATEASGALDPGLDGDANNPSPRDVSIRLIADIIGIHVLTFTTGFSDGTSVFSIPDTTYTVTVVPEPGTGMMLGLGLAGLAIARSRV